MSPLDVFGPDLVTEAIRQIVIRRILDGGNLATEDLPRSTVKLCLIIIHSVHPHEVLYQEEAAILFGLSRNTFAKRQAAGEFAIKVNVGK